MLNALCEQLPEDCLAMRQLDSYQDVCHLHPGVLELGSKGRPEVGCGLLALFAFSLLSLGVQAGHRCLGKWRKECCSDSL